MRNGTKNGKPWIKFTKSDVRTFKSAQWLLELFQRTEKPSAVVDIRETETLDDAELASLGAWIMAELCRRRGAEFLETDGSIVETPRAAASVSDPPEDPPKEPATETAEAKARAEARAKK